MQFDRLFESKAESTAESKAESKAECGPYFTVVKKLINKVKLIPVLVIYFIVWLCLVGSKYIRERLSDDNVVESEKRKTPEEEVVVI